jgi:hypothetical protein
MIRNRVAQGRHGLPGGHPEGRIESQEENQAQGREEANPKKAPGPRGGLE